MADPVYDVPEAYYLEGDDGQPFPELVWCRKCGIFAADHYRRNRGHRGLMILECWTGDDSPQWCAGCRRLVDTGPLTTYAIDSEFEGFSASPPDEPCLETAQILGMMLSSLYPDDDPRGPQIEAWLAIATPAGEVSGG